MHPADMLERSQWDTFWTPVDTRVVDRPELMYLACPRPVLMLNMVVRVRAAPERFAALVSEVKQAHAGRPSRWVVRPLPGHDALERALAAAGYVRASRSVATTIAVNRFADVPARGVRVRSVETLRALDDACDVSDEAFGRPGERTDPERRLRECTGPGARVFRAVAYDDASGRPIASGGLTVFPSLRFGFLWAGCTVPSARGRGAYRAVLAARLAHAQRLGLERAGLYALETTSAPIVARLGFEAHEIVANWEATPPAGGPRPP